MAGDAVSYTAGSWAHVVSVATCPGESSLPEPTLSVLWWTCLQPYLTKAEAWRNEPKYGRAAHSSDGSMQIIDNSLEAVDVIITPNACRPVSLTGTEMDGGMLGWLVGSFGI